MTVRQTFFLAAAFLVLAPGCAIVETGVTNPLPGMATVAVAPFFNLTAEPTTNGRQFALAYYAELQKVPGFDVIPVGVTETALAESGLDLDNPADAVLLASKLGADAVVVGAVTEYSPYYPPRIGLRTAWYAPEPTRFVPGIPADPGLRESFKDIPFHRTRGRRKRYRIWGWWKAQVPLILRAQSPGGKDDLVAVVANGPAAFRDKPRHEAGPPPVVPWPVEGRATPVILPPPPAHDPLRPVMSYTRIFDAADAEIAGLLRDEAQLTGDQRGGGWEATLHRTDDFIRFASRRMIIEMLALHGGEARRRYVWVKPERR